MKKIKIIKIITMMLAVLTMTVAFVGCGKTSAPGTVSDADQSGTQTSAPETYSEGLEFELNGDGAGYTVIGIGSCKDADLIIPSKYKDLPVTAIGSNAFNMRIELTSVTIPEGVTAIGDSAFMFCQSMTSVTIPESVTEIDDGAFRECTALTSVTIPEGVTVISQTAFRGCTSLESVTIPAGVTAIGDYAFNTCETLASITIPNSLTEIGRDVFTGCNSLTSIHYGGTVAEWGKVAQSLAITWYDGEIVCTDGTVRK